MTGAIIGDVIGSRFEFHNIKTKEFSLFTPQCRATDDSYMTMAVAMALCRCNGDYGRLGEVVTAAMREIGNKFPHSGYGMRFAQWLGSREAKPYNSCGNGAGMRVSPVGFVARSLEECRELSRRVTEVTHNHPEGIKGAEAVAVCVFLAKNGASKEEIRAYVQEHYYPLDFTLDSIRPTYKHTELSQDSVPQAIEAFLESTDFEDAIRNAVSIGGDSDTIACMAGAVAEAYYGLPDGALEAAGRYCPKEYFCYVEELEEKFGRKEGKMLDEGHDMEQEKAKSEKMKFIAIDFETANHSRDSAISIGLVKFENGVKTDSFYSLIKPEEDLPKDYILPAFTDIHGLTYDDIKDAPSFRELWDAGLCGWFCCGLSFVAHNASFDMGVLHALLEKHSIEHDPIEYFDSLAIARKAWTDFESHRLPVLAEKFGIEYDAHNALSDAETCGKIVLLAAEKMGGADIILQ